MAKTGLGYYTIDTDRYQDRKIKRLKKYFGCKGIAVYDYILCEVYRTHGCFLEWDENTVFDVAEYFDIEENTVREVVLYCGSVSLFDKELLSRGIITSVSIQNRYLDMCHRSRRTNVVIPEHCCLINQPVAEETPSDLNQEIEYLKTDEEWLESLSELHRTDKETLHKHLEDFRSQCIADGKEDGHDSMQDVKQHFNNWFRIVTEKSNEKDRSNNRSKRKGNVLCPDAEKTYSDSF